MNIHKSILLCSYFIHILSITAKQQEAITIVPVADLTGQSLQHLVNKSAFTAHYTLPICGKSGQYACPRIHQLLFNEMNHSRRAKR